LYQRPTFTGDVRLFGDLLWYAPGMNTTWQDLYAALEAEAAADPGVPEGAIDPGAWRLIEQARAGGWQTWTIGGDRPRPGYAVSFNAAGQFTWDVVLECGLRERVICDGKTLWHLYPEIGVGSRRQVSRFHRADLLAQVPWLLPPVEDLARGADVRLVAKGV